MIKVKCEEIFPEQNIVSDIISHLGDFKFWTRDIYCLIDPYLQEKLIRSMFFHFWKSQHLGNMTCQKNYNNVSNIFIEDTHHL